MARALGWSFRDAAGRALPEGGGSLARLVRIERPDRVWTLPVLVLCDVQNPLTGPRGAARVYGPQKGATAEQVEVLDAGLVRLAEVMWRDLGVDVADLPGAGAAGGLGAGARVFLGARLASGAEWMIRRTGVETTLAASDLVVTGEGRYDAQSGMGKVTGRLLELAEARGVPALLVCGAIEGSLPRAVHGIDGAGRILGPSDLTDLAASGCRALESRGRL
jgi:glycerate kinase